MNKLLSVIITVLMLSCNNDKQIIIPEIKGNIVFFNGLAETLSVLDIPENRVYNNVQITGMWPNHLVLTDTIILVNSGDNSISLYDDKDLHKTKEIYLGSGKNPWMTFPLPNTDFLYISCYISDEVIKVNKQSGEILKAIKVGKNPEGGCLINNRLYIGNTTSNSISIINTLDDTIEKTVNLRDIIPNRIFNPQSIIPFKEREEIHVICTGENSTGVSDGVVIILNSKSLQLKSTIEVGGSPIFADGGINFSKKLVYLHGTTGLGAYNYETYKKIGITTVFDNIFISGLLFIPETNKIYLSNFAKDEIYILNGDSYNHEETIQASDGVQQLIYIR
ncbi:hypothetical protein EW093_11145 [Thiospirochaeta perfilievii]|uniref:YncE family protein n=1 Tax=Thiospirochaeta perfilievii TaxID=252967 RepID=A0A5C1QEX6_9SPIO|nr:hypothetical protein [Thiospirochaeta perfilievii]QEN05244.1 hypothetical protein EW093_11145 [Thiospirochaeta perfilievii]